jgi:hypothetical protein
MKQAGDLFGYCATSIPMGAAFKNFGSFESWPG